MRFIPSPFLIVILALSLFLVAACKKREASTPQTAGESYKGPAVKSDWHVRWLTANPDNLNPITSNDGYGADVTALLYDSLVWINLETGEPEPRVAESWTISDDGLTYRFKLRSDIRFHDGQPLTAKDIQFTFDIANNPKTDSAPLRNYIADIKEVKALSPVELQFTMKRRYYRNMIVLGTMPILPQHIYGKGNINTHSANRSPIGSGPYKFGKWETGRLIELDRFSDWWGNQSEIFKNRFNFEKILFRVINEQAVAAMALKKGEIDAVEPTPTMYLKDFGDPELQKTHYRIKFETEDGNGYRYICWNLKKPLFQSKSVRQALAYLMPREEINTRMFEGLLNLSVGPSPYKSDKTDPDIKPLAYDVRKAADLLAEAGWKEKDSQGYLIKNGQRFSFQLLFTAGSTESERTALIYQQALKEAGIDMGIRTLEWTVFLKQRQERKFDALMMSWGASLDSDPYQIWHSSQEAGQGSNAGSFANARVDEILTQAREVLDRKERNKLYREFSRIVYDEQPYLFLFERPELYVASKRFAKVLPISKLGLDSSLWFTPPGSEKYKAASLSQ